ncbi:MAG TPA: hypothetical protein VHQ03_08945, partial [Candidatus Dormibacteraeota bacterium]|nr:hypothetical protein [Candidatus Dormibacteraeota bacterium]
GSGLRIVSKTGNRTISIAGFANVFGWLDSDHVVYNAGPTYGLSIVDVASTATVAIAASNQTYLGAYPGSLS